jgi:hypothetical protein
MGDFFGESRARAPFCLLPIRAPRQTVLRTSSRLAPSRFHQQVLRPPGGEDTRCVQPMSATQTTCVHPHLARSQLTHATFAAGTPHGVLGSARQDWGTGWFTPSEDRFGGSSCNTETRAPWSYDRIGGHERGRFLPTALMRSSLWHSCRKLRFTLTPLPPSRGLQPGRTSFFWSVWYGSEGVEAAETTVDAAP